MKKIFVIILIIFLSAPVCFAKGKSKPVLGNGYVGTLPDVTARFQPSAPVETKPIFESTDGFNDRNTFKPAPKDIPAFINIVQKKDKTSQYSNDINYIVSIIEKIEKSLENGEDTQKFNASAYFLNQNVEYLRNKYQNRSESSYVSFKRLMQLNMQVQTVAQLRKESTKYSPYLAYSDSGYIFSPNNINTQMEYLLKNIEDALVILKETR